MPKSKDDTKKVFDVSKPGKTAANATSRPVIVGHKNMLQDPMVTTAPSVPSTNKSKPDSNDLGINEASSGEPGNAVKLLSTAEKVIEPPKDDESEESTSEESDSDSIKVTKINVPDDEPKPEEAEPTKLDEPEPAEETSKADTPDEPTEPEQPEPEDSESDTSTDNELPAVIDDIPEDKDPDSTESDKSDDKSAKDRGKGKDKDGDAKDEEDPEKAAQAVARQKLIDDKTYFVPIGEQKRKRSTRRFLMVIIFLLLIIIAAGDLLIDNGTIQTDIRPPVDLIQN